MIFSLLLSQSQNIIISKNHFQTIQYIYTCIVWKWQNKTEYGRNHIVISNSGIYFSLSSIGALLLPQILNIWGVYIHITIDLHTNCMYRYMYIIYLIFSSVVPSGLTWISACHACSFAQKLCMRVVWSLHSVLCSALLGVQLWLCEDFANRSLLDPQYYMHIKFYTCSIVLIFRGSNICE